MFLAPLSLILKSIWQVSTDEKLAFRAILPCQITHAAIQSPDLIAGKATCALMSDGTTDYRLRNIVARPLASPGILLVWSGLPSEEVLLQIESMASRTAASGYSAFTLE